MLLWHSTELFVSLREREVTLKIVFTTRKRKKKKNGIILEIIPVNNVLG